MLSKVLIISMGIWIKLIRQAILFLKLSIKFDQSGWRIFNLYVAQYNSEQIPQ